MRPLVFIMALLWDIGVSPAHAQDTAGNGKPGMQIANNGAPNGVAACASCHGAKGEGNAGFPRIAGQPQRYLARQLAAYANGSRANPVMAPIAKALTLSQIEAVTAYYAGLAAPSSTPAPQAQTQSQKRGQELALVGDEKLGVQGCANCHGPGGTGEPPSFPYLAGQHSAYLTTALSEWKSGARNTDPSMQMSMLAKRLSDNDIAALAMYYAAQPAPPPEAQRANVPMGSAARPAAQERTQAGATPIQGVGTEQGEATSGGSQGPGGGGAASGSGPSGSPKENAR